jgi:two-component system, cell cycle sensor histidine kinase and response regulator CckA
MTDTTDVEPRWSVIPARVQAIELGRLRAVALAMMASIPFAMGFQLLVAPSLAVTLTSGAAWLVATVSYLLVRRTRIPARLAGAVICLLWLLAASSVISGYAIYRDDAWTSLILVLVIANGTVQLARRYVILPSLAVAGAWIGIALSLDQLGFQGLFAVVTLALGWLAHTANRAFVDDVERLRGLAEARTLELAAALEGTQREMAVRERAEHERERLREQFIEAQKMEAIGTLAGGLAHDVNNLLAGVLSLAELVREVTVLPAARTDLDGIIAACQRGGEMTRNMVAFSRRGTYRKERIDLEPVARQVALMLTRSAPKRVKIELELTGTLEVDGDAAQLAQALVNLCLNSIDAISGDGTITVGLHAAELAAGSPASVGPGSYVVMTVTDTGTGMTEATRARMFEPFFTTKPQGSGTGLGLAMVYGAVQSHGGSIVVESTPERGTKIAIYIPVATLPSRLAPPLGLPPSSRRGSVLVVDDEPVIRITSKRVLERNGYDVVAAESGSEAIERFRANNDVVVVLDMSMPGMGGAECFRELRAIDPGARVLLVSGYAIQDDIRQCLQDGACGFVAKPFASAVLLDAVEVIARGDQLPLLDA